jgi:hypothetical protein
VLVDWVKACLSCVGWSYLVTGLVGAAGSDVGRHVD